MHDLNLTSLLSVMAKSPPPQLEKHITDCLLNSAISLLQQRMFQKSEMK